MKPKYDLRGWEVIADYLGVTVTTARKWARSCREDRLPVSQVEIKGVVLAKRVEIDQWMERNNQYPKPKPTR